MIAGATVARIPPADRLQPPASTDDETAMTFDPTPTGHATGDR